MRELFPWGIDAARRASSRIVACMDARLTVIRIVAAWSVTNLHQPVCGGS
jgi:hypothetical protein